MSLVCMALRICTVYALRNQTFAGPRVHDSPGDPLQERLPGPIITVFSGASSVTPTVRELIGTPAETELSIHVHIPDKVSLFTGAAPLTVDTSSGGSGVVFDFIWRQVTRALLGPNEWAELWRIFAAKLGKVTSSPYILEVEKGARFESREFRIPFEPIFDPDFAAVQPKSPWARLLALMEAEPETAALAAALRYEIEAAAGIADWRRTAMQLGLAGDELAASGLAPIQPEPPDAEPVAPVTEWTVEDDGTGETFTVDASTPDPAEVP